jgi:hypothetical protein
MKRLNSLINFKFNNYLEILSKLKGVNFILFDETINLRFCYLFFLNSIAYKYFFSLNKKKKNYLKI